MTEKILYLIIDRHNSTQLSKLEMLENANNLLEKAEFLIWNLSFKKVITFSQIGVYRIGEQKS